MAKRSESVVTYHNVAANRRLYGNAFVAMDWDTYCQYRPVIENVYRGLVALEGNLWGCVRF